MTEFIRRQEVLDAIEKLRAPARVKYNAAQKKTPEKGYWDGYEEGLLDLLDVFHGQVHHKAQVNPVTPCIHGYLECATCNPEATSGTRCSTKRCVENPPDISFQRCIRPAGHAGPHFFA